MSESPHFKDWRLDHWQYAYGQPTATAIFKDVPEDFIVTEKLGYDLTGEGENLYLLIEKTSMNTQQVCMHLAKVLQRRLRDVGYAGLKDKHAITRQWFSIQMNVKQEPDLTGVETPNIKLLQTIRHNRKLKVGSLKSNQFDIQLKSVSDIADVQRRLTHIAEHGVPNYFGEQRFGFKGNNLNWANRMADGEAIRDKKVKGFGLSGARSFLFNEVLSARLAGNPEVTAIEGDVFELAGSNSYFQQPLAPEIHQRLAEKDIYLTGPMFGDGEMLSKGDVQTLENDIATQHPKWVKLLVDNGLKQERRALWLYPQNVKHTQSGDNISLSFELPSGTFATSVIRECIRILERENTSQ